MIRNLKISNLRCFERFDIQGFERINLFGGKNNSGKTALLEALFLGCAPSSKTIAGLRRNRDESSEFVKAVPGKAWDALFFDKKEKERRIVIILDSDDKTKRVELDCHDSLEQFSEIIDEDNGAFSHEIDGLKTMMNDSEFKRSALNIYTVENGKRTISASMLASSRGIIAKNVERSASDGAIFIPAFLRMPNYVLAEEFDKSDLEGHADETLKALRIIDDSIIQIKTLNIGKPAIYLKRKTDDYLPITLFGEAVNRVAQFVLKIVNNRNGVLLIDEIENGVHYTNQGDLWRMLFKLSIEFDIQIFAVTHSFEMIKSFAEAAHEMKDDVGAYFEITRNIRTNRIVGVKREIEILKYELSRGMELRGE